MNTNNYLPPVTRKSLANYTRLINWRTLIFCFKGIVHPRKYYLWLVTCFLQWNRKGEVLYIYYIYIFSIQQQNIDHACKMFAFHREIFSLIAKIWSSVWVSQGNAKVLLVNQKFLGGTQKFCERMQKFWNIFFFLQSLFFSHHVASEATWMKVYLGHFLMRSPLHFISFVSWNIWDVQSVIWFSFPTSFLSLSAFCPKPLGVFFWISAQNCLLKTRRAWVRGWECPSQDIFNSLL